MPRPVLLLPVTAACLLGGCAVRTSAPAPKSAAVPIAAVAPPPASASRPPRVVASTPVPNPPEPGRPRAVHRPSVRPALELANASARVARANAAARVQPSGSGNAAQIYSFDDGALFQVYTAPGRITDITLQPGEALSGTGPVAVGDTVRWVIGDTESGSGAERRVHILVKPTRPDLQTNLVINTSRRTYHLELRAMASTYMPSIAWRYPQDATAAATASLDRLALPAVAVENLNFRYRVTGDGAAVRPLRVFDDGRQTVIEFPTSIDRSELPPLFVCGADGRAADLVNYRVVGRRMIVDRLFACAEMRLRDRRRRMRIRIQRVGG
jgi:P-type conjugative transfer protein TrbG